MGALGALPGLVGMFQKPYQNSQTPTNINPWSDGFYQQMQGQNANLNNLWQQSLGDSRTAGMREFGQSKNWLNQMGNVNYDPMAAQRQFMSEAPGLQALASRSVGNTDTEAQLASMRAIAGEGAASRFGGSPTGSAMQQSVMRAMMEPEFAYRQNQNNLAAQMTGQLFGQRSNALESGMWNQAQFGQNQAMQGFQGWSQLGAQAQAQEMQRANMLASMLGQTQNLMGQFAAPEWWSPNMINNPNYGSPSQFVNDAGQIAKFGLEFDKMFPSGSAPKTMPTFNLNNTTPTMNGTPWAPMPNRAPAWNFPAT